MEKDLSATAGARVEVILIEPRDFAKVTINEPEGICLDEQTIDQVSFTPDPAILATGDDTTQQTFFSRLFRSCCPVTGQPDWATVTVSYEGKRIVPESLLRYLISYREHAGFHEACVENIFSDIISQCHPAELTVSARFTRRGGIDINPIRSTGTGPWPNLRDPRQ